jgi:3-oxoacyl-[acyl-carrier protein] reductase
MKTAWVTGSAKRLGKAIALKMADQGYYTFVHYHQSRQDAEQTLSEIVAHGGQGSLVQGDVGNPESVRRIASEIGEKTGRLDVLVHNVGVYRTGPLLDLPPMDFEALWRSNTLSLLHLVQAAAPLFTSDGGACIAIGYSGLSNLTGTTHNAGYLASKTALLVLVKSLALELGPRRIRVNMVSPGILDNSVELPKKITEFTSLNRLGTTSDIAEAVAFLVGGSSSYITGMNIEVAGGYMLELKTLGPQDIAP